MIRCHNDICNAIGDLQVGRSLALLFGMHIRTDALIADLGVRRVCIWWLQLVHGII